MTPQPRVLLLLLFRTTRRITDLPFYQGTLWSALFRELMHMGGGIQTPLAEMQFYVHPVETGRITWARGEPVHLGISFPASYLEAIALVLHSFNSMPVFSGKLNPGSLVLDTITCRITGRTFHPDSDQDLSTVGTLTQEIITQEAGALMNLDCFEIIFHAPLRLKSPADYKRHTSNRFIGRDFFFSRENHPLAYFLEKIGAPSGAKPLDISNGAMVWLDCPYGGTTTLGGIMGWLSVAGSLSWEQALALAAGQYSGLGKNRVFGFGFYHIQIPDRNPDLISDPDPNLTPGPPTELIPDFTPDMPTVVRPLCRGLSLFHRAATVQTLKTALGRMSNASPGSDGLTAQDLQRAGPDFLAALSRRLKENRYTPGRITAFRKAKKQGGYRVIHHFPATDRLVHKSLADTLQPAAEKLLSDAAFAYRRGLNRQGAVRAVVTACKEGFDHGIKADIKAFFDSVDTQRLCDLLKALFPFDPLPQRIGMLLDNAKEQDIQGLAQGSPLSPVLSNLYLDRFDREMQARGFRLIRFGDDFVLLFQGEETREKTLETVAEALKELGLTLHPDKTLDVHRDVPFTFLGYEITGEERRSLHKESPENKEAEKWLPVFQEQWYRGVPVYLTSICRGAYSSGPHLVVTRESSAEKQEIPWNRINRIVVVGRAGFSSGCLYRAVKEDIPVLFIDVMGRENGVLLPTTGNAFSFSEKEQETWAGNYQFCLAFAQEIITAKIINSHVLLRRNKAPRPKLKTIAAKAGEADSMARLLGFEGSAARIYFQALSTLTSPFVFKKRVFHPPDSPVNAMLSFGYTLLYHRIGNALRSRGLNPLKGFFHQQRGRHQALASDLMEELRHVVDRIVLAMIHRREVNPDHFSMVTHKGVSFCRMNGEAFRRFIRRYETVMAADFTYSETEKMSYNAYIDEMVDKLIRAMKLHVPYTALRIK